MSAAAIRAQFPLLAAGGVHYLDSAASAQIPEAALDAMRTHETTARANVRRGVHRLAEAATAAFEDARGAIAAYLSVPADEVVITSGCTAALNLVARAWGRRLGPGDAVALTELEHHANIVPWQLAQAEQGFSLRVIPTTAEGRLDLAALDRAIDGTTRIIAATHVSNVTGAISDVAALRAAADAVGALLLLDGAQAAPHGPLDLPRLGADLYALSGHKLYGPNGIGVLWGRAAVLADMPPFLGGGDMIRRVSFAGTSFADPPRRFEAGTPPIAQAVGLAAACRWAAELDWEAVRAEERRLTGLLIAGLRDLGCRIVGPEGLEARIGVVSFELPGVHPHDAAQILDARGVAVRAGHHCAQPLMDALGLVATTRASLAPYTIAADVTALLDGVAEARRIFTNRG